MVSTSFTVRAARSSPACCEGREEHFVPFGLESVNNENQAAAERLPSRARAEAEPQVRAEPCRNVRAGGTFVCLRNVSSSLMLAGPPSKAVWDILAKWEAAEIQQSPSPAEGSVLGGKAALNFHGPGFPGCCLSTQSTDCSPRPHTQGPKGTFLPGTSKPGWMISPLACSVCPHRTTWKSSAPKGGESPQHSLSPRLSVPLHVLATPAAAELGLEHRSCLGTAWGCPCHLLSALGRAGTCRTCHCPHLP